MDKHKHSHIRVAKPHPAPDKPLRPQHHPEAEPLAGRWQFKETRMKVREETERLAPLFRSGTQAYPADFRLRIARITIAMYFLDQVEDISKAAKTPADKARAANVSRAATELLGSGFFTMGVEDLRRGAYQLYVRLEPLSRKLGLRLLKPEDAVNAYIPQLSKEIDALNGR
jgi:hypothetical protein